jgi:hypothetical protein
MKTHSFTNKAEIKLRAGGVVPIGAQIELRWTETPLRYTKPRVRVNGGEERPFSISGVIKMMGKKQPSESTLMKWDNDGYSKSVMGQRVEPDGHDEYGSPSWLLVMGLI